MARVKRGFKRRRRHNSILKFAKGYRERRRTAYRRAVEQVHKGWVFAYEARKQRKRELRGLWIARISAAARMNGVTYSQLIQMLKKAKMEIDRKILADMAANDSQNFKLLLEKCKKSAI
jgi:large subunit ribosomal protein L20